MRQLSPFIADLPVFVSVAARPAPGMTDNDPTPAQNPG